MCVRARDCMCPVYCNISKLAWPPALLSICPRTEARVPAQPSLHTDKMPCARAESRPQFPNGRRRAQSGSVYEGDFFLGTFHGRGQFKSGNLDVSAQHFASAGGGGGSVALEVWGTDSLCSFAVSAAPVKHSRSLRAKTHRHAVHRSPALVFTRLHST